MPTLVDFRTIGKHLAGILSAPFANEPARHPCDVSLTVLIVAARSAITGLNRALVVTTDHPCPPRWFTATAWAVQALNNRCLQKEQRGCFEMVSDALTRGITGGFTFDSDFARRRDVALKRQQATLRFERKHDKWTRSSA